MGHLQYSLFKMQWLLSSWSGKQFVKFCTATSYRENMHNVWLCNFFIPGKIFFTGHSSEFCLRYEPISILVKQFPGKINLYKILSYRIWYASSFASSDFTNIGVWTWLNLVPTISEHLWKLEKWFQE